MSASKSKDVKTKREERKSKLFRLKSMVLARILAELTVILILINCPLALLLSGQLASMPAVAKAVVLTLCVLSALLLPAYAFITWCVKIDEEGITSIALAKKQHCSWSSIKRITRRSNWNWVRYVVEHQDGELSFPIWMKDCDELIETIKSKLPKGAGAAGPIFRKFSQDPISLMFQCLQAGLGVALASVFWLFFTELSHEKTTSQTDSLLVLAFCTAVSALFLWRTFVVLLMPKSVRLTGQDVTVETMFFGKKIAWQDINKIGPAPPFLPEGFMLSTKQGSFLIGNGMNSADELVASIQSRLQSPKVGEPLTSNRAKAKPKWKKRHRK